MTQEIWYTVRNTFDPDFEKEFGWEKYIAWSKLTHLKELVSLDGMLNELIFMPDYDSEHDWEFIVTDEHYITNFFRSIDFVLGRAEGEKYFNLIAAIKDPSSKKSIVLEKDFEFVGYELLDLHYGTSALSNCGGFDESFKPNDLNEYGLVSNFHRAKKIQKDLIKNNPEEHHADCNLFEVWRHKTIGRKVKAI